MRGYPEGRSPPLESEACLGFLIIIDESPYLTDAVVSVFSLSKNGTAKVEALTDSPKFFHTVFLKFSLMLIFLLKNLQRCKLFSFFVGEYVSFRARSSFKI